MCEIFQESHVSKVSYVFSQLNLSFMDAKLLLEH